MIPAHIQPIIDRLKEEAEYYELSNNHATNSKRYKKEEFITWEYAIILEKEFDK